MTEQKRNNWKVDPNHSQVQFKVKHLAISNVAGVFKVFNGEALTYNDDFTNANIRFEIAVNSLDTNNGERDKHLTSAGFLNAEQYPTITFKGTLQPEGENFVLAGDLSIAAVTRAVQLQAEYTGTGAGRFNDTRAGFEVEGKIRRKDFDLNWNILTEAGGFVIGEEIKLHFDIQLIKQAIV